MSRFGIAAICACLLLAPTMSRADLLDLLPLRWLEKRLLYAFSSLEEDPAAYGLPQVRVSRLRVPGASLVAWSAPPRTPGGPVLLYFHGNAGNLAMRAHRFHAMQEQGFGFVAPGLRGSSGSGGSPSEKALIADARVLYAHLPELLPGLDHTQIVLYGESLGTAIVTGLMATLDDAELPSGVVLEAPFTSIPDIARGTGELPENLLRRIRDRWNTLARAYALRVALWVIHGTQDPVVPIHMGRDVFAAAGTPEKDFVAVVGAAHSDTWRASVKRRIWTFVKAYAG